MTEKQKIFCEEYIVDLNATRAYKAAYPNVKNDNTAAAAAARLLRIVNVREYIDTRLEEKAGALVAKQDEVLQYLTEVLRDDDETTKSRLKAAELLGKRYALFTEKVTAEVQVGASQKFADIVKQLSGGDVNV